MKLGGWQGLASAGGFLALLAVLVSVDPRVRERFTDLLSGGDGMPSWGHRASYLGGALVDAVRYQSIENAPLVVFAVVGFVLVVCMMRM